MTLAAPGEGTVEGTRRVHFDPADPAALRAPIDAADMIVSPPHGAVIARWLHAADATLIFDLYDPGPLEALENFAEATPLRRWAWNTLALDHTLGALHLGNRFLCASERQRDLWLGTMLGRRLITPGVYGRDPTLRSVIDVVPFGVSEQPPAASAAGGARARFPALGPESEIVLWNGGLWDWLDPVAAVRAFADLADRRPAARLVFMGAAPTLAGAGRAAAEARALARDLGLLDRLVFFNDAWVPYEERGGWLLEADCAISAHGDHLETRFAFRTRLLDCFWAQLPVVCTEGDDLAGRIVSDDLGAVAPPGDSAALAAGLERVLGRGRASYGAALARAADAYAWPVVAAPLVDFVVADTHPPRLGNGWPSRPRPPCEAPRRGDPRGRPRPDRETRRGAPTVTRMPTSAGAQAPPAVDGEVWPAADLEEVRTCPVCDGPDRALHDGLTDRVFGSAPGRWRLVRCTGCGSGYLDPRPTAESIARAYAVYYTHGDVEPAPPQVALQGPRQALANDHLRSRWGYDVSPVLPGGRLIARALPLRAATVDREIRHLPAHPGGRLLDVGCGTGAVEAQLRRLGWNAEGLGPGPRSGRRRDRRGHPR